jgi:hypothetical protein
MVRYAIAMGKLTLSTSKDYTWSCFASFGHNSGDILMGMFWQRDCGQFHRFTKSGHEPELFNNVLGLRFMATFRD